MSTKLPKLIVVYSYILHVAIVTRTNIDDARITTLNIAAHERISIDLSPIANSNPTAMLKKDYLFDHLLHYYASTFVSDNYNIIDIVVVISDLM